MNQRGTIWALASGSGAAGVAVIRVSGPQARACVEALAGDVPAPRVATLRTLRGMDKTKLDKGLVLWFPGPGSFTGEDCAEFHVHGGPAIVAAIGAALASVPGVGLAEPGAFTRRAFENGKLDLTQAEAIADLVAAETESQRKQALRQLEGELGGLYARWREALVTALSWLDAEIDFPDEALPGGLAARARDALEPLAVEMAAHLEDGRVGERVREGFRVAILGEVNAGKSALLNALAGTDAAIVSDLPGTTRDVVEVRLVLGGQVVWIADTAGLRETSDVIESEGIRRALARADAADLVIRAVPAGATVSGTGPGEVLVRTKADLVKPGTGDEPWLRVSAVTGEGVAELRARLGAVAAAGASEAAPLTRRRHREGVEQALADVRMALVAIDTPELAAESVRAAGDALGRIVGRIGVEEVLDRVFSEFCIGK
jgi:tRNA modification GTPase